MLLEHLRSTLTAKLDERAAKDAEIDATLAVCSDEKRDLNDAEAETFAAAKSALATIDEDVDSLRVRIADEEARQARKADLADLAKEIQPEPTPQGQRQYRVKSDEPTYHDKGKHSFFQDALAHRDGQFNPGVTERLSRYSNEVRLGDHGEARDVGTAAGGALVVPNYLPQLYAENLRAGRITANLCHGMDLPPQGMTIVIPRGTTGTVASVQTAENQSLTEVDFDETSLTVNVRTYGGLQDVSRQFLERGYQIDSILYQDLAASYAANVNVDVINGAGTSGSHTGILNWASINSVTTGTATFTSVVAKVAQAIAKVNETRFLPADVIIMHPRRWGWMTAQSDSNGRPVMVPGSSQVVNSVGSGDPANYGLVGELQGLPVFTDAGIPTTISTSTITGATEDNIIVARRADLLLWENGGGSAPRQFRFEDVGSGTNTIRLSVLDESAFTAGWYPKGVCVISGSGMGAPTYP